MDKKANLRSYAAVVIFLFAFGFVSIFITLIYTEFTDAMDTAGYYDGQIKELGDAFLNSFRLYDYMIVFVMVILIIGIGVTSYKVATAPAFFVVTLIMGFFLGALSYFFNYIFIQLVSPAIFTDILVYFPRTMIICTNLHWVSLIATVTGSITLFAKREKGQFLA